MAAFCVSRDFTSSIRCACPAPPPNRIVPRQMPMSFAFDITSSNDDDATVVPARGQ